ncbi:MAG: hypothetical protein HY318_14675 [Armatimonadetes bacterium]|nr:hypothetical protein [Armatimonadota bacterium]
MSSTKPQNKISSPTETSREPPLRLRALVLGLVVIVPNCYWIAMSEIIWYKDFPTCLSLFVNSVFTLALVVAFNRLLAFFSPRLSLNRFELLVIYSMTCAASSLASLDMIPWIFAVAAPAFRIDPVNDRWDPTLLHLLPRWLVVTKMHVLKMFYEGHTSFYRPEYLRAWAIPLAAWFAFVLLLLATMLCLTSLFSQRWIHHEKLSFPILEIPLAMVGEGPFRGLFSRPAFLLGAGLGLGLDLLNGLSQLYPVIPCIHVKWYNVSALFPSPYNQIWFPASLFPFCIGLSYFLPADIAFSTWFFFLIRKALELSAIGLGVYEPTVGGFPSSHLLSCGGLLGLGLMAFWRGGPYWKNMVKEAMKPSGVSADLPLSPRATLVLGSTSLLGLMVMMRAMGLQAWLVPVYVAIYFLFMLAITRLRVELGPISHEFYQAGPNRVLLAALGSRSFTHESSSAFTLMRFMNAIHRSSPMPQQMEAMKIAQVMRSPARRMVLPLVLASLVGLVVTFWTVMHQSYRLGNYGVGDRDWFFTTGNWLYQDMHEWITNPRGVRSRDIAQLVVPLAAVFGFGWLRTVWFACPFHPAGLALGFSSGPDYFWLPLLVAWSVKVLVLRYGGRRLYLNLAPFFIGLVLGEYMMAAFWGLFQLCTGRDTYSFWLG